MQLEESRWTNLGLLKLYDNILWAIQYIGLTVDKRGVLLSLGLQMLVLSTKVKFLLGSLGLQMQYMSISSKSEILA